jgi:hypothetical protein
MSQYLYAKTLDVAGYGHEDPTEENVRNCFADYVDAGIWRNLNLEDCEEITTADMCAALIRLKSPAQQREG